VIRDAVRCEGLRLWGPVLGILFALFVPGKEVHAQVTAEEEVDSARLAILERLQRLARPPGYDSVLYIQDSIQLADAALGIRSGGSGGDAVSSALLGMPGYSLTEYAAASADFEAQARVLVLQAPEDGRARVSQEGLVIEADTSITFDEASGSMRTVGDATFTPPDGDAIDAANMIYDLNEGRGSALDAQTSLNEGGAQWIVRGDMPYAAQDSTFMSHARFTSCDHEEPHYHFETDEIKIVGGNVLVARGVRLYFADVPVAWLPFLAQSLSRGRASGMLTPRFSVNDIVRSSGGYRRRVSNIGFYWAMNDYADALVSMDWFSETFFSLTSSIQYRSNRRFLDGNLTFRQFWREGGKKEIAVDTRHSWDFDERTQLRVSGRFVTSTDFVRETSFNPQEVTQSIDSDAGINRRFDWGTLSMSASRKRYMSDDRTEWLLPSANLSLSPITLFKAPSSEAHFWNNMTWAGSGGARRNTMDRLQPSDTFSLRQASTATSAGFARSSLSLGNLTFAQGVDLTESETLGVPEALLLLGDSADPAMLVSGVPLRNIADSRLGWSTSVNYQQQLVGSTTITPRLSLSGAMFQSDTSSLAPSFVGAPPRIAFGAQLKTDIYGFFGGVGPFEAIRHKFSPSFDYAWSPESTPNELQRAVFGSRALQPKNRISVSLTQTFEAKRRSENEDDEGSEAEDLAAAGVVEFATPSIAPGDPNGAPTRLQQTPTVNLLALRTSVVQYDFVEADSVGLFLSGFETTRLSNQISSDYLRGLSISMDHQLFEDDLDEDGSLAARRFAPRLSQVNLSFSLGSSSSIFRWLNFGGRGDDEDLPQEPAETELDFRAGGDESSVIPVTARDSVAPRPAASGSSGGWNANLTYSMQRPQDPTRPASKMLSGTVRMQPTPSWSVSWRTAYDLEAAAFNDHSIRLSRDLHRWQANFDFLQTATGNWTFRFEVSLLDNRDLKFDYKQRNLDLGLPTG
jgi:hypothetical protein